MANAVVYASQITNRDLLVCAPETATHQAAKLMKSRKTSSILIQSGDDIVGIFTEADSTKISFTQCDDFDAPISNYMSSPVISIRETTPIQEIIMAFHRHRVRHLLVVDENNSPIGITSQTDVIKKQGIERYLQLRKIKDNFNPRVPIVNGTENVQFVANKMAEYHSTSAIIHNTCNGDYGIITERDLLRLIAEKQGSRSAWHHAAHPLLTIDINDSLYHAYTVIKQHSVRHLVVYDKDNIVGILSLQHILSDMEIAYIQKLESVLSERDSALKESRKHLSFAEKIIEASLDSVMVTDRAGTILSVNPAFTQLTGYCAKEAIGKNASLLSSGKHNGAFYKKLWQSITDNGMWQGEILNKKKNGDTYSEWLTIVRLAEPEYEDAQEYYAAIFSDITERKLNEKRIHALAFFDELTGLPNRRLFNDRFEVAISTAHRNHQLVATMFLDLDRFKQINDNLGHKMGDELLKVTAERLQACIKEGDTVSRFGGDEFVILLTEMNSVKDIVKVAERISKVLCEPYELSSRELHVTSSIGVAIYPDDGETTDALLKHADIAMYKAKDNGRNSFQLYSPEMNIVSMERLIMQNCLRIALKKNEFELHYQSKVDHQTQEVVGIEALVRWNHSELGRVSPAQFIPMAEELGLIVDIDTWVLNTACQQRRIWLDAGVECGPISVNISALHFNHDLVYSVQQALEHSSLPPHLLELEITEGCFIQNMKNASGMLAEIRALGVKSSIDDFGTGYSSLSYLSQLAFDTLKIDCSFIKQVPKNAQQCQLVTTIIAMAKALDISVVAEGVETHAQVEFLSDKGCFVYQGYYYNRPGNAMQCTDFLLEFDKSAEHKDVELTLA
ncbi:EAL domain-containing protein [Thalassotalea marina]|uniref:EAL domain-containing protein n=1 Tax=Thalassotalea marina TaxID=1673741 RepID=A0A919EJ93_9GAMM|nr:EAL domain-containing protein [Thalassotalea marina]GHF85482.1 hypothetical protein GCM10017161_11300 [Thalassotalea marina]